MLKKRFLSKRLQSTILTRNFHGSHALATDKNMEIVEQAWFGGQSLIEFLTFLCTCGCGRFDACPTPSAVLTTQLDTLAHFIV